MLAELCIIRSRRARVWFVELRWVGSESFQKIPVAMRGSFYGDKNPRYLSGPASIRR